MADELDGASDADAALATAGPRTDELDSSAMATVTRLAATAEPDPELEAFG